MKHENNLDRAAVRTARASLFAAACTLAFLPVRAGASEPIFLDTPWNEREGKIPTPNNRQQCYEDCEYDYGKETEKCNRLPKKKRPECHSKALAKRTKCRDECEKKYPE